MAASKKSRKETRVKIKALFRKFKDSDIEHLKGYMDKLSSKGQKAYENNTANGQVKSTVVANVLKFFRGGIPNPS